MKHIRNLFFSVTLLLLSILQSPAYSSGFQGLTMVVRGNLNAVEVLPPYDDSINFNGVCVTTNVENIDFNWGEGPAWPACSVNQFATYFYGFIKAPVTGMVYFFDQSDDGFYMTIDNKEVISDWELQGMQEPNGSGRFKMTRDQVYSIKIWNYENTGGAGVRLFWNIHGSSNFFDANTQIVPTTYFATDPTFWGNFCAFKGNSGSANNTVGGNNSSSPANTKSQGAGACQNSATRK